MALRVSPKVVVAGRTCSGPAVSFRIDCASTATLGWSAPGEDLSGSRCSYGESAACLQGPILKARVNSAGQRGPLVSSMNSSSQTVKPVGQYQGSSTLHRNRIFINELATRANSIALIDIEDGLDGSILFKYGALEDIWDVDRLLAYLCHGAITTRTIDSYLALIIELFKVPISLTSQRRMVELLSSYIRLNPDASPIEMGKRVSQLLAEATSEFLPPPSVGTYSKGSLRPLKRFSSRVDKWWKEFDDYFAGDDTRGFFEDGTFPRLHTFRMRSGQKHEQVVGGTVYEPFGPNLSRQLQSNLSKITWKEGPAQTSWLTCTSTRLSLAAPRGVNFDLVREDSSFEQQPRLQEDTAGSGFVLLSPGMSALEDTFRKGKLESKSKLVETAPEADILLVPCLNQMETLPTSSIQAMVQWEQDEAFVTLPSREGSRVKFSGKKTTQRTKSKATRQMRGRTSSTKPGSKRRTTTERRDKYQLCDMLFSLPLSHKCSGVATFLVMRKDHSEEMLLVLNQVAVGLAGAGLAVTLQVVARMLSLNSTFDSLKMFRLIQGASLIWLSAAMQNLRQVMLHLPPGCTIAGCKDKEQLLCLQRRLRSLSFRALTVMVLMVIGHGL